MHKLTIAALAIAFAPLAFSQDSEPASRAEVKAQTRALEKAGKLAPAGEGLRRDADTTFKSTKTRADRKTETRLANKRHELAPPGVLGSFRADAALRAQPTTRSRPERKAETRLAEKQGKLIPAGERPDVPRR